MGRVRAMESRWEFGLWERLRRCSVPDPHKDKHQRDSSSEAIVVQLVFGFCSGEVSPRGHRRLEGSGPARDSRAPCLPVAGGNAENRNAESGGNSRRGAERRRSKEGEKIPTPRLKAALLRAGGTSMAKPSKHRQPGAGGNAETGTRKAKRFPCLRRGTRRVPQVPYF